MKRVNGWSKKINLILKAKNRFIPTRSFSSSYFAFEKKKKIESLDLEPEETIFAKIVEGKIPCKKLFEDEYSLAFYDIQ